MLANAAVEALRTYLNELAVAEGTDAEDQVQLIQLGRAHGAVINGGVNWQVALLVFMVAFSICAATVIFVDRVRAGWREASLSGTAGA